MIEKLKAPVSVYSLYNHKKKLFYPHAIFWEGRRYITTKVGYHHSYKVGKVLFHVFSVETKELFFRLVHDTHNLSWIVEEISDGEVD